MNIAEMIEMGRRDIAAYEEIQIRFPNAEMGRLHDGRIAVLVADIGEPDGFEVVSGVYNDRFSTVLCPFTLVQTIPVYILQSGWRDAGVFFTSLKDRDPEVYKRILDGWV